MNTIDRKLITGVFAISAGAYLYLTQKPTGILGMDSANSKKFVGSVVLISAAILLYKTVKKPVAA